MESMEKLYARFTEAKQFKDRWLALYKELYFYVIPNRDAFNIKFNYTDVGKPVTQQVWDDTAVLSAYQRANDLHGLLLPKDRTWGRWVMDPHLYDQQAIDNARPAMDEINSRNYFYINQSNLSRVVSSSNLDLVGGTGVLWVESISDDIPLYFRSVPAVATYIEYSTDDLLNTCWYAMKMTGRKVLSDFPNYQGKIRDNLVGNPNDTYLVNFGQIKIREDLFYMYAFLDDDPFYPLFERERRYNQLIIYRDRVRPGEAEGRGVGTDLLPTIRDLNQMVEYRNKNYAYKAYPPMFYEATSYFNPWAVRQWAGMMIPKRPGSANPIQALEMPTYPDVFQTIQDQRNIIRTGFQVDPLGTINDPVRSATEVSIRENRAQRTSATDISRLINELPKQIFDVCGKILNERGLLVKKRQEIPGFDTAKLKFAFQSPLYDIQNQQDIANFVQKAQITQQFYGEGAVLASSDLGQVNDFLTEKLNLPSKLYKNQAALAQFLRAMAQQTQPQPLPSPATSPAQAQFPQPQGMTI